MKIKIINIGIIKFIIIIKFFHSLIFLLSSKSQYINGQNLIVDDGWSL